jgi:hypothetical protein
VSPVAPRRNRQAARLADQALQDSKDKLPVLNDVLGE